MLYEKKMLILSGDGCKGVVLMEKTARGVRFSLTTFDTDVRGEIKAGVITRSKVFVRDLPQTNDPAASFTLDIDSLDGLHFAVFDASLRLYGALGAPKMWEANVMDLLRASDKKSKYTPPVQNRKPLPPIADRPKVLPLPDGTGLPQSRLAIYGDEALAESDFYTPLDMTARMQTVDSFLDSPRILTGLAPEIVPRGAIGESDEPAVPQATTERAEAAEAAAAETETEPEDTPNDKTIAEQTTEPEEFSHTATTDDITDTSEETPETPTEEYNTAAEPSPQMPNAIEEAAAVATAEDYTMPWERTAIWLKKRSRREASVEKPRVRPTVKQADTVKKLREQRFFERARNDITSLFENAPKDDALKALLPDMDWVAVDFDGNRISVGKSGEAFLCYAVNGEYGKIPPLGEQSQWLPRDRKIPTGKGYWLIFQNLNTGEIVKSI